MTDHPRGLRIFHLCISVFLCGQFLSAASAAEDGWTMYRGNAQRTANTDGKAGPDKPNVLWAYKSQDHFVAAPTPMGDRVFFTGLGAFNVGTLYSFAVDPKADPRVVWSR